MLLRSLGTGTQVQVERDRVTVREGGREEGSE